MEIMMAIGLAVCFVLFFMCGCIITLHIGKNFVDNYVEKMTPEKLRDIERMAEDDPANRLDPLDEALWARGLTRSDVDNSNDEMED